MKLLGSKLLFAEIFLMINSISGFPDGSVVKNLPTNAVDMGSVSGSGRFLWRRKWQPTPVFLPGEALGQRSLAGYSPWGCKELDTTEHTYKHARKLTQLTWGLMQTTGSPWTPCFWFIVRRTESESEVKSLSQSDSL